jgi:4-hydroxy-2-oxoheptanedioate aldolase
MSTLLSRRGLGAAALSATALAATRANAQPVAPATPPPAAPRLSHLIETFAAGRPALGIFSAARDIAQAAAIRSARLDYTIIDMEHAPFDPTVLQQMLLNLRAPTGRFPVTPIVRIGANGREIHMNQWMVKQVLDLGAFGIMVPFVNTAEEARNAVIAMRYPPLVDDAAPEPRGQRGWSPGNAVAAWNTTTAEYARRADLWPLAPHGELVLAVQVETRQSVENLEAILSVPGVSCAFVGPADVHSDMGYRGRNRVPEVERVMAQALATAKRLRKPIGLTTNAQDVRERLDAGWDFITVGGDTGVPEGLAATLRAAGR